MENNLSNCIIKCLNSCRIDKTSISITVVLQNTISICSSVMRKESQIKVLFKKKQTLALLQASGGRGTILGKDKF